MKKITIKLPDDKIATFIGQLVLMGVDFSVSACEAVSAAQSQPDTIQRKTATSVKRKHNGKDTSELVLNALEAGPSSAVVLTEYLVNLGFNKNTAWGVLGRLEMKKLIRRNGGLYELVG